MVRYSAPQTDDHVTEMEWTTIPDESDDDEIMICDSMGRFGIGPLQSRGDFSQCSPTRPTQKDHGYSSSREIINLCDSDSHDGDGAFGSSNAVNGAADQPQSGSTSRDIYNCLQTMRDNQIQHMEHELFLDDERKKRRKRRLVFVTTLLTLVGIILFKYAPPPPALKLILPSSLAVNDSDVASFIGMKALIFSAADEGTIQSTTTIMQQHDSWTSYCRVTLQLFMHAIFHQVAVFWYALSESFTYASQEIRHGVIHLLRQYFEPAAQKNDQTKEYQGSENAFTKTWCPIRIPAASNHDISLPRGANANSSDRNLLSAISTEDFLRQSIGASLSPQNLALTLLAEGIDSWGGELVESASVQLVHRMSAALQTGLWIQENGEEHTQKWILPPATGLLLVGPEGVGKLHTARLLGHWLFGHCDGVYTEHNSNTDKTCFSFSTSETCELNAFTSDKSSPGSITGVLEINMDEYGISNGNGEFVTHSAKTRIVNHLIQRLHQGSVIIFHHIEAFPLALLSELSQVIMQKSHSMSYTMQDGSERVVSTNGTVFIFTSKQWGTKNIFEEIQRNGMRTNGLRRDSLLNTGRWEMDSHFQFWSKVANVSVYWINICASLSLWLYSRII